MTDALLESDDLFGGTTNSNAATELMDAMNAALLEDSASENLGSVSGHSSLLSVDVMDEAMLLLSGDGEISKSGEETEEEEIDFADFLAPAKTTETVKKVDSKTSDEESDNSPTSVITGESTIKNTDDNASKAVDSKKTQSQSPLEKNSFQLEQPQVVPLKQFENALALIQDLENRIAVLETDQQCLLEENEQLKETVNQQATVIATMEDKLERFPKLLEQTVQEEAKLAAAQASAETKVSFWKKDLARQEREELEEKQKKARAGNGTTQSLRQSDFLSQVVERNEQQQQQQQQQSSGPRVRPVAIFNAIRGQAIRGWGNRNNNNNNNNNASQKNNHRDGSNKKGTSKVAPSEQGNRDIVPSNSNDESSSHHHSLNFDGEAPSETNNVIEDDAKDSKVLDLMT